MTVHIARLFEFGHLTHTAARDVSEAYHHFAAGLIEVVPDGPELTVALRMLLSSKDAAVRAVIYPGSA